MSGLRVLDVRIQLWVRGEGGRPWPRELECAAWLAASTVGVWPEQEDFQRNWLCQRKFSPKMLVERRDTKVAGWNDAVARVLSNEEKVN